MVEHQNSGCQQKRKRHSVKAPAEKALQQAAEKVDYRSVAVSKTEKQEKGQQQTDKSADFPALRRRRGFCLFC